MRWAGKQCVWDISTIKLSSPNVCNSSRAPLSDDPMMPHTCSCAFTLYSTSYSPEQGQQ